MPPDLAGERFDRAAARLFSAISRSELAAWIRSGELTLEERAVKPSATVAGGERIQGCIERPPRFDWDTAQEIEFVLAHEDADLLVVNKPAGLVVHPGAGQPRDTLVNGLLHHRPELATLPRAGLVHRLDKDTSGLLVVAGNAESLLRLGDDMRARRIERRYLAVVEGVLEGDCTIDRPIGRHPTQRTRQAVRRDGRPAVTHIAVRDTFTEHSLVEARLETGRTHQIRVHLASIGHPIVGDERYGAQGRVPFGVEPAHANRFRKFPRQALHAHHLAFTHPQQATTMRFDALLPEDMARLLAALRETMP